MTKKNILDFFEMKQKGEKIVKLPVNDYPFARLAEQAGVDMILVGDSLGMTAYGLKGTMPVTMDQMITHCQAVRRGAPNTWIIGDMPFGSYHKSVPDAIENASRFFKEADVDCVKLEGGRVMVPQIRGIISSGMPVMGHIGITPQSVGLLGGFKAQGNTADTALVLLADAKAIEEAGAFALILEGTPAEVGKLISENVKIPVIGAGSGPHCDGQATLASDLLGLFEEFTPRFVKKYANLAEEIRSAFKDFASDVRSGSFPEPKHCYKMKPGESEKLEKMQ
jgi:3-methyl-2-oxobutanoate hydroxymethyltransferase